MTLFLYHLRLAILSLRRTPVIVALMLLALVLSNGVWSLAVAQLARFEGYGLRLSPTLHQVEILHSRDANSVFAEAATTANAYLTPTAILARTQQSYPEMRRLATSRAPALQNASVRGEVIVRGPTGRAVTRVGRFTNAEFFTMFERPFAAGGPWTAAEDRTNARVVVLGHVTGRRLFPGGGGVGQTVFVEGHPFRVTGILADHQPLNAPWHLLIIGGVEDALFLPFSSFEELGIFPDQPIFRSPVASTHAALLASDTLFVTSWVDLPTAAHVAAYRADLDGLFGSGHYTLRPLAQWRHDFAVPKSQISFLSFLGFFVMVGSGFNLSRWLLTKGLMRSDEIGIFRALGASRSSIVARTFTEGMLLALPAALLGPVASLPSVWCFNRWVQIVDMPLQQSVFAATLGVAPALVVGALGALYPAWRLSLTPPTRSMGRI